MLESLVKDLKDGVYRIYPAEFEEYEILDMMAPSFVIAKEGERYLFIFDPRSVTSTGFFEDVEKEGLKKYFEDLLGESVKVGFSEGESIIESMKDELSFYEEMGVSLLEDSKSKIPKHRFEKVIERFKIFSMISKKSKGIRHSAEANIISISPGMAGLSLFVTLDSKFMIWLRNETAMEGSKLKYSLIRVFNVIVAKLSRYFKYERMSILPYESLLMLSRDVEKVKRFLRTIDVVNEKARDFFVDDFPKLIPDIKESAAHDLDHIIKSKETFLENLASLPDRRAFEHFKERVLNSMEKFCCQLDPISKIVEEWMDKLLEEVEK